MLGFVCACVLCVGWIILLFSFVTFVISLPILTTKTILLLLPLFYSAQHIQFIIIFYFISHFIPITHYPY